jgi:beta-galactosidase
MLNGPSFALLHDTVNLRILSRSPVGSRQAKLGKGELPEFCRNRKILVEFDGIYQNSEVWINGTYLGRRPNGYIPFFYDLTPHLSFNRKNVLAVRVDNSLQPNCRWYSGSGIYRHTWLLATHPLHVGYWGTFVTFPRVAKDEATVRIKTQVENHGESRASCTLVASITDREGNTVHSTESVQEIGGAPGPFGLRPICTCRGMFPMNREH